MRVNMKSQRFAIPRLPFGKFKQTTQQPVDENKLVGEEESVDEQASIYGENPVDEQASIDGENPVDEQASIDGEKSVEEQASIDGKNSVAEEKFQQTREEQLASVIQEEEVHSDGEDCELHVYERRIDTRGEEVF